VNLDSRTAVVESGLEMDDGSSVIYGRSGLFDLENNEGLMQGAKAGYPPWRIRASEAEFFSDRRVVFRSANFTSCDEPSPHYRFRASSVRVRPGKYIFAWNPVFFVGRVPLFYSPFLWKSLRKKHLVHTRVSPGYDRRNGAFARTTTLYSFAPWAYGKLYLDYYGAQGPAVGTELQHRPSEDLRGVLYAYRIRETNSGRERWTVLGSEYATLGSSYAFQGRLQAQSDAEFNNHYQRSNAFRVTPQLDNSAAFVRRGELTTTRISYSRVDVRDPADTRFLREGESMPRIELQTAPLGLRGVPWLATVNLFADNRYERQRNFLQRSAGARAETTRTLNIVRGLSLTPRFALSETYESRRDAAASFTSTRTYYDAYTGRYELGADLRLNSRVGYWDADYARVKRTKPGTFEGDAGAPDYGVEKDLISLQHTLLPWRSLVVRSGTGYDFRKNRDQSMGFRRRVQPFFGDFNWSVGGGWQVSMRDEYQLDEGNRSFLVQADWGDRRSNFAGFGVVHTIDRAGTYLAGMEGGWAPSSATWRYTGALRYDVRNDGGLQFKDIRAFEKELTVVKDFHDFQARVLFRVRPGGIKEVAIRVEMTGGGDVARKIIKKGWESEWFPWRKHTTEEE
jgi:LPS-assembly protein